MPEHSVQILFPFTGTDLSEVFKLEEGLAAAIDESGAGHVDQAGIRLHHTEPLCSAHLRSAKAARSFGGMGLPRMACAR